MDLTGVDFSDADESGFDPIPAGWYEAVVQSEEDCPTKDGTGRYLKVCFQILGPDHVGRLVWQNYNWKNKSEKAQAIGKGQLKLLARATGKEINEMSSTAELIGKPVLVSVGVQEARDGYAASNKVMSVKPKDGTVEVEKKRLAS